ncbi:hypothetical protein ACFVQ4_25060 [Streptomyces laurentii]|uniref:hypothetical protein n=1 Tax=Streptomyces laurentii TaxID=39478 RepID=UPI0036C51224
MDDYPVEDRLPLLTRSEAREAVRLLQLLADDPEEGLAAGGLAGALASRLPAPE